MSLSSARSATSAMSFRSVRSDASKASTAGRSQFYWQKFRSDVLLPHHIRVLPAFSGESLPESILAHIDISKAKVERFTKQRCEFREKVANGKGFRASAFFPPEVLPSVDEQPLLSRCMVPSYAPEALPERMISKAQSKSDLTTPRPGLGLGFSKAAFTVDELARLPRHLSSTGTLLHTDIDTCTSGSELYAPFMSFERVFSTTEYGVDLASNQCAVDGAWSVRALQMLYAAAVGEDVATQFDKPTSFSCSIDNEIAVINYHWVDHAQTYCMAPIVKFNLTLDGEFNHFLLWIEAISKWAVDHLLPEIKRAIGLLSINASPVPQTKVSPVVLNKLSSIKTDYDHTQWQKEDVAFSPSVSSTASWGSPMIDETVFDKLMYPRTSHPRNTSSDSNIARLRLPPSPNMPISLSSKIKPNSMHVAVSQKGSFQPEPSYEQNPELVMKKRLGHAMVEIDELQNQMLQMKQEMSSSVLSLKTELSAMRKAMTSMVRKEKVTPKQRSPLLISPPTTILQAENRSDFQKYLKPVITTPTEFRPIPVHKRQNLRSPSGLSNVLTPIDTNISAVVSVRSPKSADSVTSPKSADSDLVSPGAEFPPTPLYMPSPSIAPSDAISCISCLSCRRAATVSTYSQPQTSSHFIQSIVTYRKQTSVTTIIMQLIILICVVDYMVLLCARFDSIAVTDFVNLFLGISNHT